jgi:UDP-N-acetylmuramoylalanine--D-glutamate ligase
MLELIRGKEVLVVGMARSGMAAVELLAAHGALKIIVTDQKEAASLKNELNRLSKIPSVKVITGSNPPELVTKELSLIIASPGVPPHLEIFRRAEALSIPVISEIELAYTFLKTPVIGVTGTNGKTTTTALITAMINEAGIKPVEAAGNIGNPLSGLAGKFSAQGFIVAELSSFQLDRIAKFRPFVAVFLNFAEDHTDYHGSVEAYFQAKTRIFENQQAGDFAILNEADLTVAALKDQCRGEVIWFNRAPVFCGAGLEEGWITIFNPGCEPQKVCMQSDLVLPGEHNLENCLAATAAAWATGVDPGSIGRVLKTFKPIEHRLEKVLTIDGVDYINDSKGTNPGATIKALRAFPGRPIVLIAGGKDKSADFSALSAEITGSVKSLILLGETKDKLAAAVKAEGFEKYIKVDTLAEAVTAASKRATEGDLVLLSPACASWDMFSDFESRGNIFKELVRNISNSKLIKGEL